MNTIVETILLLYFLVPLNFLFNKAKDFSCPAQKIMKKNMYMKHILIVLSIFFIIVYFIRSNPIPPYYVFVLTIGLYMIFVLVTRCDHNMLIMFILIMIAVFYLEAEKVWRKTKEDKEPKQTVIIKNIELVQLILQILSFVVIIIGVIIYIGKNSNEFGNDFTWIKFWFGEKVCKNNKIKTTFRTNFKKGVLNIIKYRKK